MILLAVASLYSVAAAMLLVALALVLSGAILASCGTHARSVKAVLLGSASSLLGIAVGVSDALCMGWAFMRWTGVI